MFSNDLFNSGMWSDSEETDYRPRFAWKTAVETEVTINDRKYLAVAEKLTDSHLDLPHGK